MNLQPYTRHKAPTHLTYPKNPTELDRLTYRLRAWGEDDSGLMIDAADMLQVIAKERDAADARVKVLEAENIALRALAHEREAA